MKISKIINNNLVHFYDENNVDCIAMGRGLGFGKKIGDEFGAMMVEKSVSYRGSNTYKAVFDLS